MKLNLSSSIVLAALVASPAPAATLVALWDFSNPGNIGQATVGQNLIVEGTAPTHNASLPDDSNFVQQGVITTTVGVGNHFRVSNPIGGNGGGTFTNSYSLVFDLFSPADSRSAWRALLQTDATNGNDGDFFIRNSDDNLGVAALSYSSALTETDWTRIVLSFNVGTEINGYVNGSLFHQYNADTLDDRFSLGSEFLLFADEDGENGALNVGMVAFFDGALTEAEAAALGRAGNPVPEPATGLLLGGLAAAATLVRRRK